MASHSSHHHAHTLITPLSRPGPNPPLSQFLDCLALCGTITASSQEMRNTMEEMARSGQMAMSLPTIEETSEPPESPLNVSGVSAISASRARARSAGLWAIRTRLGKGWKKGRLVF